MSNTTDDYISFSRLSAQLENYSLIFWLSHNPSGVIRHLLDRIKLGAKVLGRAAGIKHSIALGHIAVAAGFPNWHGLNAHLTHISASPSNTVSRESIARLAQSLIFLTTTSSETSLSTHQDQAFQGFGAKLSAASGLPLEEVMDTVCAGLCGGASWSEVNSRSPLTATLPRYEFEMLDGASKAGRFIWSDFCGQLLRSLDDVYQNADKPELIAKAKRWMEMTIYHDAEWMLDCLRDARKQLRLNPHDNFGVRDIYLLMLLDYTARHISLVSTEGVTSVSSPEWITLHICHDSAPINMGYSAHEIDVRPSNILSMTALPQAKAKARYSSR